MQVPSVYWKRVDYYILALLIIIIYWSYINLINLYSWVINARSFPIDDYNSIFLFQISVSFASFSYLIALARPFSKVLNRHGEKGYLALFLTLVWQHLSSHSEVWCFTCISFQMLYMKLRKCLSVSSLLRILMMNGCWILSDDFFPSPVDLILWLSSLDYCYYDLWLLIFKFTPLKRILLRYSM